MTRRIAALILAGALHAATPVPVLVELFTSEGCSSCPPADALLVDLDSRQPVPGARAVVLSEHVDYWNQLGWRDPYSSPQFSNRQAEYARVLGSEVFTPQIVIDGREQFVGSDAAKIQAAIAHAAIRPKAVLKIAELRRDGDNAAIALAIPPLAKGKAEVWIAVADDRARSSVSRGENSGRTLEHVAVVRSLIRVGSVTRSEAFEKTVRAPLGASPSRVVVFIKESGGPVLGAESASIP